jgi:hypothetical protein
MDGIEINTLCPPTLQILMIDQRFITTVRSNDDSDDSIINNNVYVRHVHVVSLLLFNNNENTVGQSWHVALSMEAFVHSALMPD